MELMRNVKLYRLNPYVIMDKRCNMIKAGKSAQGTLFPTQHTKLFLKSKNSVKYVLM